MPFIFVELNALSRSGRYELYASDPQSLEEILLYYLCPICSAEQYDELQDIVGTIQSVAIRAKMASLLLGASAIRRDSAAYRHDGSGGVQLVETYKIKPPTDRLGGLYSDEKLLNVLGGMSSDTPLPPMKLRATGGGDFSYEVIDGIHRYYASIRLGHGKLPATIG